MLVLKTDLGGLVWFAQEVGEKPRVNYKPWGLLTLVDLVYGNNSASGDTTTTEALLSVELDMAYVVRRGEERKKALDASSAPVRDPALDLCIPTMDGRKIWLFPRWLDEEIVIQRQVGRQLLDLCRVIVTEFVSGGIRGGYEMSPRDPLCQVFRDSIWQALVTEGRVVSGQIAAPVASKRPRRTQPQQIPNASQS